ncbi:hypothetical protein QQP08_010162 [Theobroma cacao]|nr:hypothetical protein QQP08_010162 [Theobroma cacao]
MPKCARKDRAKNNYYRFFPPRSVSETDISTSMARGIPTYDGDRSSCDCGGGSGRQYITTQCYPSASSSFPRVDSFYYSSLNRGTVGDVFFGTDDIRDTRDSMYKEDVMESYCRETAIKSLRRQSKKRSISTFGCVEFLKLLRCCCRCII